MLDADMQISEARRIATEQGKTEMKRKALAMFQSWAMTHPNEIVRDDLWDLVVKLKEEL